MDLKKELASNKSVLILMPGAGYNKLIIDNIKKLSGKSVCYVTLNKTFDSLKEIFSKNKINIENITFIDAISKTLKNVPDQTDGCYYVSSPAAMTEMSIAIEKFLRHEFSYLVFDSITNLSIYESKAPVSRFLSSLINKISSSKTSAAFYAILLSESDPLIKESEMLVDKVIDLTK